MAAGDEIVTQTMILTYCSTYCLPQRINLLMSCNTKALYISDSQTPVDI